MRYFFIILLLSVNVLLSCSETSEPLYLSLPRIFGDHMVMQQNSEIMLWGEATPESEITIQTGWGGPQTIKVTKSGKWDAELPTPEAGGSYELKISNKDTTVTFKDILLGEVWLASGQSNMEMPLEGWPPNDTINYSRKEIKTADYPAIRMFTVQRALSAIPAKDVTGEWQITTPENAASFSATAYFFARKLHKELNVPVGIVHASWGGTPAESWVSEESLRAFGEFDEALEAIDVTGEEQKDFDQWKSRFPITKMEPAAIINTDLGDIEASKSNFNDSKWMEMKLPTANGWEPNLGAFDGVVWFRKKFNVKNEPSGTFSLSLGPVDDMDVTYINGIEVGKMIEDGLYKVDRIYAIPDSVLVQGENTIAIKVIDTRGGGGIYGAPEQLYLEDETGGKIELAGTWKYQPVAEYRNSMLYQYGLDRQIFEGRPKWLSYISPHTGTVLYNGMIAPVIDYTFQGAIWYQGESNVGRAEQYGRLFPQLIKDWRNQVGKDFPFYFVQIAPYNYKSPNSVASAGLRDAQRKTLSLPNTGMVVTLDIGNNINIHPGNKQEVGKRLALWALNDFYDEKTIPSGPLYRSATVDGNRVNVQFDYAGEALRNGTEGLTGFEIAGSDSIFYKAGASIEDSTLVLFSPLVSKPLIIRYAWSDTARATLFNNAGLPASSFSEEIE